MGRPGKKAQRLGIGVGSLFDDDPVVGEIETNGVVFPGAFDTTQPERSYRELIPFAHRRRYGQFFTPEPIAELMLEWVGPVAQESLLDPAVGPGVFLRLARKRFPQANLVGVDIEPVALEAAKRSLGNEHMRLILQDFLTWRSDEQFGAIVANPPYLRHHDIHYASDIYGEIGRRSGVVLSRLSNIYVLFIMEMCRRLKPSGRASIIVPGEWTNANFGMALKQFLLSRGYLRKLIYFSNLSEQFEDALTTAAILLIEKPSSDADKQHGVTSYFIEPQGKIDDVEDAVIGGRESIPGVVCREFKIDELVSLDKWDKVLRDGVPEDKPGFVAVGVLANSRRGIATGANEFFHLTEQTIKAHHFQDRNLKKCVGRADDVKGLIFGAEDFETIREKGGRAWLLSFEGVPTAEEQRYLDGGMAEGLNERFLLAGRKPWYSMERRPPAPIWAAVFGRKSLRFIYNEAGVSNLTTFHCIYPTKNEATYCRALVACLNSRLVQTMAEHQRRVYGGGLMKFEPKDLLSVLVPNLGAAGAELLDRLSFFLGKLDKELREDGVIGEVTAVTLDSLVEEVATSVVLTRGN